MIKWIKNHFQSIVFWFVLLSLVGSIVFVLVQLVGAPVQTDDLSDKEKSDYVLMLLQCVLGILVLFLPSMLEKRLRVFIPDAITTMFFIFLYAAIYLGEVRVFYYKIPNWDMILHAFSGMMVGALGFSIVDLFNRDKHFDLHLSPGFVTLVAFMFACTVAVLWEFYEFGVDYFFGTNMQKYALEDGSLLLGQEALQDTMEDLIIGVLSGGFMCLVGYFSIKNTGRIIRRFLLRFWPSDTTARTPIGGEGDTKEFDLDGSDDPAGKADRNKDGT